MLSSTYGCLLGCSVHASTCPLRCPPTAAFAPPSPAVAEEGIDVKSCQLVVRYDLPNTAQVSAAPDSSCLAAGAAGPGSCNSYSLHARKNGATGTSRTYSADSRMSCLYRCLYCCMYRCCSPQSYIQSRGRARMLNSELLMFVQQDLSEERQASAGCCRC